MTSYKESRFIKKKDYENSDAWTGDIVENSNLSRIIVENI